MIRLNIIVEGQTEESFVNNVLQPFFSKNKIFVIARCVETSRTYRKIFRGGLLNYKKAKIKSDLFERVDILESEFSSDISHTRDRFIPYFQVFEFEAILFADLEKLKYSYPDQDSKLRLLRKVREEFTSPEHINDNSPPSKRIKSIIIEYYKINDGTITPIEIGIELICKECRHFNEWINKLLALKDESTVGGTRKLTL